MDSNGHIDEAEISYSSPSSPDPNRQNAKLDVPKSASSTPTKLLPIAKIYRATSDSSHAKSNAKKAGKGKRLNDEDLTFQNKETPLLDDIQSLKFYVRKKKKSRSQASGTESFHESFSLSRDDDFNGRVFVRENEKDENEGITRSYEGNVGYGMEDLNRDDIDSCLVNGRMIDSANSNNSNDRTYNLVHPDHENCRVYDTANVPLSDNQFDSPSSSPQVNTSERKDGQNMESKNGKRKRHFEGIDLRPDKIPKSDGSSGSRFRDSKARKMFSAKLAAMQNKQRISSSGNRLEASDVEKKQKWTNVCVDGVDPVVLLNFKCKVYWPLEFSWFEGVIDKYDEEQKKHHVTYLDGDEEDLCLSQEKLKLFISKCEMRKMKLKDKEEELISKMKKADYDEMMVLAATYDDYQGEPGHGDLIWAKVTGHSMWPAFVMDEAHASACGKLEFKEGFVPVQFFGSHDYASVSHRQIVPFSKGFLCNLQQKCQRVTFYEALAEVQRFLKEQKLPEPMAVLQTELVKSKTQSGDDLGIEESDGDDFIGDERNQKVKKSVNSLVSCPIDIGQIRILSLGTIVRDSEHFHDEHHIWPVGYTAVRKFNSIKVPDTVVDYKMEVLRSSANRSLPLFRISLEDGENIDGSTPNECWKKIYARLDKAKGKPDSYLKNHIARKRQYRSGSFMFGFSDRRITKLLQDLPHAKACSKFKGWIQKDTKGLSEDVMPAGYRPVNVQWKDLDRCNVCHMEEEYLNNVFLQCDKCRMMVHANCYGEPEPDNEELWICQLCRLGTSDKWPPCSLCPITGGAMKQTTDGRWAHLTCATWIPETCLVDVKKMEPIDGLHRINKDRWKLVCTICKVHYGACIQCSDQNCRVAYHPLCARAAGLRVEVLEDNRTGCKESASEDGEQRLRLLSYCKRHGQPIEDGTPSEPQRPLSFRDCSGYTPPPNLSGCARCEPYNFSERRGRKQPESASIKRLFVENRPYLVSGCCKNGPLAVVEFNCSKQKGSLPGLPSMNQYACKPLADGVLNSMVEKYQHMRATFRKRLAFGKSGIHGYGIFAKQEHKAGDMVIEYTGEIVRPIIADIREHCIYNSLVGAGTYMFRIDDDRVIDATRSGSIAHLINHSCEPNCYSRTINVCGDDHIIIFAKRDIQEWEELTYDYRFCSMDEQLACYCGFARCRGVVNVNDPEEQEGKLCVPRSDLVYLRAEIEI